MGEGRIFESWLDEELQRAVSAEPGPTPQASHARYRSAVASVRPGLVSTITGRGVALVAAAALALGGGAVALAAAATGSVNPVSWGHAIVRAVQPAPPGGHPALDRPSAQPAPAGSPPGQPAPGSSGAPARSPAQGAGHGMPGAPSASAAPRGSQVRGDGYGNGHDGGGNGHDGGGNGKTDEPESSRR